MINPEWMAQAACADADPELFFPEKGRSPKPAKLLCATCPVAGDCLTHALDMGYETSGVWGGTTEKARRTMTPRKRYRNREAAA